jgi:hypothetical protein
LCSQKYKWIIQDLNFVSGLFQDLAKLFLEMIVSLATKQKKKLQIIIFA